MTVTSLPLEILSLSGVSALFRVASEFCFFRLPSHADNRSSSFSDAVVSHDFILWNDASLSVDGAGWTCLGIASFKFKFPNVLGFFGIIGTTRDGLGRFPSRFLSRTSEVFIVESNNDGEQSKMKKLNTN